VSIKEFTSQVSPEGFMVWWDVKGRSLDLVEFDRLRAIVSLKSGKSGELVIPVWLDVMDQRLDARLKSWEKVSEVFSKLN
jgi:hypothetical protein